MTPEMVLADCKRLLREGKPVPLSIVLDALESADADRARLAEELKGKDDRIKELEAALLDYWASFGACQSGARLPLLAEHQALKARVEALEYIERWARELIEHMDAEDVDTHNTGAEQRREVLRAALAPAGGKGEA
jgi:hypothetical protein